MIDKFTFANDEAGKEQRKALACAMWEEGRTVELGEEKIVVTLLTLDAGPRPDSGKIAKAMKEQS